MVFSPSSNEVSRQVVFVTGLSGAGRSTALKALEDQGYEAIDNVPVTILELLLGPSLEQNNIRSADQLSFLKQLSGIENGNGEISGPVAMRPLALGIDTRTRGFGLKTLQNLLDLCQNDHDITHALLFIDCDDDVIIRRFTETRRSHPLAVDRPLRDGISLERELLDPLRDMADIVINTSDLSPHETKRLVNGHFPLSEGAGLTVNVVSFSFKRGIPREADLVFDVRFLQNPHYIDELRPMTGLDGPVAKYVASDAGYDNFFTNLTDLVEPLLPRYLAEGKSYLTIAVGCTGGRHRSVYTAQRLWKWLVDRGCQCVVRHRELERIQQKLKS